MRNFIKYIFITSILLILFSTSKADNYSPLAAKGFVDLSSWNFSTDGEANLDGEWEFYWKQLIAPTEFDEPIFKYEKNYFKLPNLWNKYVFKGEILSGNGYATFRLNVKIKEKNVLLGFKIKRTETAFKIWINNKEICANGLVGKSEDEMTPYFLPREIVFYADSTTLDIVIQVSNFKHRKGGISSSVVLSSPEQLNRTAAENIGFDIFLLGVLLIMSVYHFGLFYLRRQDRSSLYFSMVCLLSATYLGVNGEFVFVRIWHHLNWELLMKINFISNFARISFFALFLSHLFRQEISRKFAIAMAVWGGVMSFFVLVTPAKIFTHSLLFLLVVAILSIIYMIIGIVRAAIMKREGARLSLLGTFILFVSAVNDTLHDYAIIHTFYSSVIGVFVFVFFQSFMLSFRFSRLFAYVENLTNRLITLDKIKNELLTTTTHKLSAPLKIIIENVGAQRGILLLNDTSTWYVEAEAIRGNEEPQIFENLTLTQAFSNTEHRLFCNAIIEEVIANQDSIVLDDALTVGNYQADSYIRRNMIRSVFCMPLFEQQEIRGILYLENNISTGAFNDEKINVIELLSSQITTIVDNVKIFQELEMFNQDLEQKVKERTAEVYQQKEEIEAQRDEIDEKNQELNNTLDELGRKNKDMTDSIKYAKRIQSAILPSLDFIRKVIPNSFVLYKPKDILSGDFYWFEQVFSANEFGGMKTEKIIIAVFDCTGHGVPGALMSIIGSNLLNYAVNEQKMTRPADILRTLHFGLKTKIKQTDKNISHDGMDLSVITYEPNSSTISFAGARNPIFLIRNDKLIEYEADKMGVGDSMLLRQKTAIEFSTKTIDIEKDDTIYLFSDGYMDQFGEVTRRKLMKPNFKRLLLAIQGYTMEEQCQNLESTFNDWKGKSPQIDDVLIMGIKFD